jgi:nucleosome assembly protein 1-like 1
MDEMPPEVLARVLKLKGLDVERSELVTQYEAERCALEAKYRELYAPLYATRAEVITGRMEVPLPEELSHHKASAENSKVGVPKFWLQAMARRGILAEIIEETDIEALGYLEDIKCTDNEKMDGFTLEFVFASNPYFENKTLTKTYEVGTLLTNDEPVLEKVVGTEIQWKKGKNLAFDEKVKKQRAKKGKNKGAVRYQTEKIKKASFFHFFQTLDITKLSTEELDEAEAEELMEQFNSDYTAANLIRTEIVPQAVLCYTGELQDSDDEDDLEFDEDSDEEDSDEEVVPVKGGGKKGGKKGNKGGKGKGGKGGHKSPFVAQGGAADGEGNPECKQS